MNINDDDINDTSNLYSVVDGAIDFTEIGLNLYRGLFGSVGININDVKTVEQFKLAEEKSDPYFWSYFYSKYAPEKTLSSRCLAAIIENRDQKEIDRLLALMKRKGETGLKVVK